MCEAFEVQSVSTVTCPNFLSSVVETSLLRVARAGPAKEDDERSKAPEAPIKAPEAPIRAPEAANGLGDPRIGALEGERFSARIWEVRSSCFLGPLFRGLMSESRTWASAPNTSSMFVSRTLRDL